MKILRGFTLAEVLVTLAILGVIASMTLPALNMNTQKQQVGPALAKAVNSLENANRIALADNDARHLSSTWTTDYMDVLSGYLTGVKVSNPSVTMYNYDRTTSYSPGTISASYTTNDGICYYVLNPTSTSNINVYVDVNGVQKKPNALGRDIFLLWVEPDGKVLPYGGNLQDTYHKVDNVNWATGTNCNSSGVTSAVSCAGAIADNGWQIKYKW